MELYWKVHEGSGPYLLLVHGMLSSTAQWRSNLPALAKVTRPVVVDLWGHGSSPSPEDPARYHPQAYVEMFEDLRVRLGADRWLVCGAVPGGGAHAPVRVGPPGSSNCASLHQLEVGIGR